MIRKNPPSFVLIDKAMGTVVYTKRATGVGSEAISACVKKGRELAQKNNRVYTVFLDIMGLKIGSRVNVGQIYHLGITEEIGPTGSAMPSGRRCCSSPDVCPSGQGMRCFNCQRWEADSYSRETPKDCPHCGASYIGTAQMHKFECPPQGGGKGMYKENPRGGVRRNIFAFNNPGNAQKILAENFVKGANSGVASSMYIHGNRIYSYGPHFPIAQRNNDGTILIRHPSKKAPSKTTAGHISAVVNAARQVFAPDSIIYDTAGELAAEAKGPAAYTNPVRVRKNIFAFNNPRQRPQNELERAAGLVGLYVTTWAPGDGLTRYRFHTKPADYSDGSAIYTANGRKEAIAFIKSYGIGRSRMNPLDQKEIEQMRDREKFYVGRSQKYSRDGQEADAAHFRGAAQESRNIRERHHAKGTDWWPNPCKNQSCVNPKHGHVRRNPLLQTVLLANPGSVKTFNETQNVGKAKYVVNYHDGVKVHHDGSPFFDIAIFSSLAKKDQFVRKLKSLGFTRGTLRNPPISAQWDRLTGRQRLEILELVGFPEDYAVSYARMSWSRLPEVPKARLEREWLASAAPARGGTTRRRSSAAVSANPLTRRESARVLRRAKMDTDLASSFRPGHTRSERSGQAFARGMVVRQFGHPSAQKAAKKIVSRAEKVSGTVMSNPGLSGIRFPKSGTKLTVEQALALASKIGDRELMRQCKEAMKLQTKANRGTKCVVWKTLPIGSPNKIEMVTAFSHYGDSPEDMYKAPKGSKKGQHMYRHRWGDGTGKTKPVPVLAAPGGKAIIKLMGPGQTVGDWMRG